MRTVQSLLLLLFLFTNIAYGQLSFVWAGRMGSNAISSAPSDVGRSIALDKDGNVYTTGNFWGNADFDPGNVTRALNSSGVSDVFVSKLDKEGKYVWAKKFGGSDYNDGNDIAIDKNGYVYIVGSFQSTTDFDPGPDVHSLTPMGLRDVFVCKLDSNGNYIWAKQFGGAVISTDQCDGYGIAVDDNGNVYTTGAILYGKADFDPGTGEAVLISAGEFDIFISKLNSNGDYVWAKNMGSTWREAGNKIAVDSKGYLYVTGYFSGTVDFDPGPGVRNLSTTLYTDNIFICRFDTSGNLSWAHSIGSTNGDDIGQDIAVDAAGNVYTTGKFYYGGADFDAGPDTFVMNNFGSNDIFICKWDSSAKFCWAKHIGASSITINAYSIALTNNFVCITGNFGGRAGWPVDFDPGPGVHNMYANPGTNNTSVNIFVAQLDTAGNFMNSARMGGPTGIITNTGFGIAADNDGNVYTTGQYVSTADFDPDTIGVYTLTTTNSLDDEEIFVSKLHSNIATPLLPVAAFTTIDSMFCNTTCVTYTNLSSNATSWLWLFEGTTLSTDTHQTPAPVCYEAEGSYSVTLIAYNANGADTTRKFQYIHYNEPEKALISVTGGDTLFCSGDSVQLCASGSFRSMQWNNGDTSACTYAKATGGYWVNTIDNNNCAAQSVRQQLSVYPSPVVSISIDKDTLFSVGAASYQWYFEGGIIPNAISASYIANQSGYYHVVVTDINGCEAASNPVYYLVTGMEDENLQGISIYPNPATEEGWNIYVSEDWPGAIARVYDATGKIFWQTQIKANQLSVKFNASAGVYHLHIVGGGQVYHARLLKQ